MPSLHHDLFIIRQFWTQLIKCLEKCNLLSVGRNEFTRLIGIDENLLKDFSKYEGLKLK